MTDSINYLVCEREQLEASQEVEEDDVLLILGRLTRRKATGVDEITNEMLKLSRYVLAPILAWLFQACFEQRCHPVEFKHAITVVLRKPNKNGDEPKSYRPVALLSNLGKVFERLITDRFKSLAKQHDLLPSLQFGAPGRNTTKALQFLLDPVYRGWCFIMGSAE